VKTRTANIIKRSYVGHELGVRVVPISVACEPWEQPDAPAAEGPGPLARVVLRVLGGDELANSAIARLLQITPHDANRALAELHRAGLAQWREDRGYRMWRRAGGENEAQAAKPRAGQEVHARE
jgi:hypothetical protein